MEEKEPAATPRKTRILLTNDDGIEAAGVLSLALELNKHTERFDVRVVCPAKQHSGQSHAISIHGPLWAERYRLDGLDDVIAWKVSGTPVDCVKVALTGNLYGDNWLPDLLLSGINEGCNTGLSVMYSGTCGAALEGTIYGYPSIALSVDWDWSVPPDSDNWAYMQCAHLALGLVNNILKDDNISLFKRICCNVNFPKIPKEQIKGWKVVKQGPSKYTDWYERHEPSHEEKEQFPQRQYFKLRGKLEMNDVDTTFDTLAVKEGYISVTPLSLFQQDSESSECAKKIQDWEVFKSI